MQKEKHEQNKVFIIYFGFLLLMVVSNLFNKISIMNIIYLLVVLCSVLKIFIILKKEK